MNKSILNDVKKKIGIDSTYTEFDQDIIMDTNSVLFIVSQMGIGREGFSISGTNETWADFLKGDQINLTILKSYVGLKVRLIFDPPTSSVLKEAIESNIKELEWRIYITENYNTKTNEHYGSFDSIEMIQPYMYSTEYTNLDYEFAKEYFLKSKPEINFAWACSSVRNGNWYGRNFDWIYSNGAEFIVKTKHDFSTGFFGTLGVAGNVEGLTDKFVKTGEYSEAYKIVPFMIVDGINDAGLVCNINVVPSDKGLTTGTVPAVKQLASICSLMIPRYVLDHFSNAKTACEWLRDFASIYSPTKLQAMNYEPHFMIADSTSTYIIEFENNELVIIDATNKPRMTNFFVNDVEFLENGKVYTPSDVESGHLPSSIGITPHGSGLERYNLIVDNYSTCDSKQGMINLMRSLFYTNSYKESTVPFWYTEFVGNELTVDSTPEEYQPAVADAILAYINRKREGATVNTWQTNHMSVYDMENKVLYLVSQEFDDLHEITL